MTYKEEIRDLFMLDKDKYSKYSHLKERVIKKSMEEINKYSDIRIELEKEEKEGKKVVGLVFSIKPSDYKYPIDNWLEYEEYTKKTKKELQDILNGLILARYKIPFEAVRSDLFSKETILQVVMEIKSNEYENTNIKYAVPYFTKVLQAKEKNFTGKEITNTELRRYEMQKLLE